MNHLFWLWAGGFVVALASTTIATGVYRLKSTPRGLIFEIFSLVFWPLALPLIYLQQNSIRKEILQRAGACPCGGRCGECESFRRDLQKQWLEHHQACLTCHPEE